MSKPAAKRRIMSPGISHFNILPRIPWGICRNGKQVFIKLLPAQFLNANLKDHSHSFFCNEVQSVAAVDTLIYEKQVLIFGCGNTLFGNDGFGPGVINYLKKHHTMPDEVFALDAGTGIRDFIFDLVLMEKKPEMILIIDAVTVSGRKQGDIFEMDLDNLPREKISDFSLHQSPSSNLLSQLKSQGVDVRILGMHTASIPNEINPGLCPEAKKALPSASKWILKEIKSREGYCGD
jgi:coenzyme F420 hydrogenase subunit delta